MYGYANVNRSTQIIAAVLIISASISSVYTVVIAEEYSGITEALVKFSVNTEYNIESVKSGYLDVNITFDNPSELPVRVYEVDYLFCIYNSSTGSFKRYGVASGAGLRITIDPHSNKTLWFAIPLEGNTMAQRNETAKEIIYLLNHEKPFKMTEYMEVYYQVADYDEYKNMKTYGWAPLECYSRCGGLFG